MLQTGKNQVVCSYIVKLLGNEMEWTTNKPNNVHKSQKHYVERKKPGTKEYIPWDSIYKRFYNTPNYSIVINIKPVVKWGREWRSWWERVNCTGAFGYGLGRWLQSSSNHTLKMCVFDCNWYFGKVFVCFIYFVFVFLRLHNSIDLFGKNCYFYKLNLSIYEYGI